MGRILSKDIGRKCHDRNHHGTYRVADGEVGANVLKLLSKVSSDDVKSGALGGREKSLLQV
jgi:hypothetical protein